MAAEEDGGGIGRIRMRRIPDATADSLQAFVEAAVTPGSLLHTDGLLSSDRLEKHGYRHRITFLKGRLVQQAVAVDPAPYTSLVKHVRAGRPGRRRRRLPQPIGVARVKGIPQLL